MVTPRDRSVLLIMLLLLFCPGLAFSEVAPSHENEALLWLQEYLQIDTTNPPGNEGEGADFLANIFEREGIETQKLTNSDGRTSLFARLRGSGSDGRALALVHHIDVVPGDGVWEEPPFSGRLRGDTLWGRGAIDVKSLGIAQLAAMVDLKRQGAELKRDLIYLAVADEELGGKAGAGWLLDEHSSLFEGLEAVLNEGGSNRVVAGRLLWWGVEVTQKRALWLKVTARGRGGHGSQLNPASATHELIRGLSRVLELQPRWRVSEAARNYLTALDHVEGRPSKISERLDQIIQEDGPTEPLPPGIPTLFLDTVQITEIQNGRGPNVIAPIAQASIDIRMLPDTNADVFLQRIQQALGKRLEVEVILTSSEAAPSPTDHPFFLTLQEVLAVRAPTVPMMMSGITDSRYFRERGIPAYGFSPFTLASKDMRGIHAPNEYISKREFLRGIETLRRILLAYALAEEQP